MKDISLASTGFYIAFPTTVELKPIYSGYKTRVNHLHTKIGIAEVNFKCRHASYMKTFDGEVQFIPLAVCSADKLAMIEDRWIQALRDLGFKRVGRAKEWFDTCDREIIKSTLFKIFPAEEIEPIVRIGKNSIKCANSL